MKKRFRIMSVFLIICMLAWMAAFPSGPASGDSSVGEIVNAGFEDFGYDTFDLNTSLAVDYTRDPSKLISGNQSIAITNGGGWNWFLRGKADRYPIPAASGAVVDFSFKYRYADAGSKPTKFWFVVHDGRGFYLGGSAVEWRDENTFDKNDMGGNCSITKSGEVYTARFRFTANGYPGLIPELGIVDAGSVIIDDVTMKVSYTESFTGAMKWDGMFNPVGAAYYGYTMNPAEVAAGNQSLVVETDDSWDPFLFSDVKKHVIPANTPINVSFKYRVLEGKAPDNIDFTVSNAGGTYLTPATSVWTGTSVTTGADHCTVTQDGEVYTVNISFTTDGLTDYVFRLAKTGIMKIALDDLRVTAGGDVIYNNDFELTEDLFLAPSGSREIIGSGINGSSLRVTTGGGQALTIDRAKYVFPAVNGASANVSFKYRYEAQPNKLWLVLHDNSSPVNYLDISACEWLNPGSIFKNNPGSGFTVTEDSGTYTASATFPLDGRPGMVSEIGIDGAGTVIFDDVSFSSEYTEGFESRAVSVPKLLNNIWDASMKYNYTRTPSQVLSGSQSMVLDSTGGGGWFMCLDRNQYVFPAQDDIRVDMSFKYSYPDPSRIPSKLWFVLHNGAGTYYDLTAFEWRDPDNIFKNNVGATVTDRGSFYEVNISFMLDGRPGWVFELGELGNALIAFDDFKINLTQIPKVILPDTMSEGFEGNGPGDSSFNFNNPAAGVTQRIVTEGAINGSRSLEIENTNEGLLPVLSGDAGKFTLASNTLYTVAFKYKLGGDGSTPYNLAFNIVKDGTDTKAPSTGIEWGSGGNVISSSFREASWNISGQSGGWYHAQFTFSTDGNTGYEPVLSMAKGSILIDDFTVARGNVITGQPSGSLVYGEDFEGVDLLTTAFSPLGASSAERVTSVNPISGSHSAYQKITGATGGGFYDFMQSDPVLLKLKPNTLYTVTMKYKEVDCPPGTWTTMEARSGSVFRYMRFNSGGVGEVGADSGSGWGFYDTNNDYVIDDGGNKLVKFTFRTTGNTDWYLKLYHMGGNEIQIDDLSVIEGINPAAAFTVKKDFLSAQVKKVAGENFEDSTFGILKKETTGAVSFREGDVINGSYSVKGETSALWYEYAHSDTSKLALKANTVYTATFRYKILGGTAGTSYNFIVKPADGSASVDNHMWAGFFADGTINNGFFSGIRSLESRTLADGTKEMYITFVTRDRTDYMLAFGIYGGGAISIDDVGVYEGICTDTALPPVSINLIHENELAEEGFESNDSLFVGAGLSSSGKSEGKLQKGGAITGSYSMLGTSSEEWWEFAASDDDKLALDPNTKYTINFKYKILSAPSNNGCLTFLCKSPEAPAGQEGTVNRYLGIRADGSSEPTFVNGIEGYSVENLGNGVMDISITFTTGSQKYWKLAFGMHNEGTISQPCRVLLDDISIKALDGVQGILTGFADVWKNADLHKDNGWNTFERIKSAAYTDLGKGDDTMDINNVSTDWTLKEMAGKPKDQASVNKWTWLYIAVPIAVAASICIAVLLLRRRRTAAKNKA